MEYYETDMYQRAITNYAAAGALAVLIWDILDNITEDYRILFKNRPLRKKLSLANCVYVLSRIGAFAYLLVGVIFLTAPLGNCTFLVKIAFAWCPLSIGATGLLFFLRLRAVYSNDRFVVASFFTLWLGLLTSSILLPVGFKGASVEGTPYCTYIYASRIAFYSTLGPLIFDTLVFIAISWRLCQIGTANRTTDQETNGNIVFVANTTNFKLTRSLLIDGQIYYLLTIIAGVASAVLIFSPLVQEPLSGLLEDPYLVLVNIMACRVFRRTRSGNIRKSDISTNTLDQTISTPIQFHLQSDNSSSHDGL